MHSLRFWLVTVAALLVASMTFSLGQWQLRRAAQKEALSSAGKIQAARPALGNQAVLAGASDAFILHRKATLTGTWLAGDTVFLDNRPQQGKTGFVVVTPLRLEGAATAIVVQRGWVQRDFTDRARLPEIPTPQGTVTVEGRIAPPPSKLYQFKGADSGRIRQNLDTPAFGREIGSALLEVSLMQTSAASDGLLRDWPAPDLGIEKHLGYAFQWFGLCALVTFLYAWFQIVLPFRRSRRKKLQPTD